MDGLLRRTGNIPELGPGEISTAVGTDMGKLSDKWASTQVNLPLLFKQKVGEPLEFNIAELGLKGGFSNEAVTSAENIADNRAIQKAFPAVNQGISLQQSAQDKTLTTDGPTDPTFV